MANGDNRVRLVLLWATLCQLTLGLCHRRACDPVSPADRGPGHSPGHSPGHIPGHSPGAGHRQTVAFMLSGGIPSSQPGLLGFRRTVTSVNSRVQPEYGSFIAEIPGLYFFSFAAVSDSRSHVRIALRRNKETVVTAFAERRGHQAASQTALLHLSTNDVVYLQVEEGCIFESSSPDQTYTSFSGYLVAPSMSSWGQPEGPLPPPGAIQLSPSYYTGSPVWPGGAGGVRPLSGPRWPPALIPPQPGVPRPLAGLGAGGHGVLPAEVPRPLAGLGAGGQGVLPAGVPRPQAGLGAGGQGVLPAGVPRPLAGLGAGGQGVLPAGVPRPLAGLGAGGQGVLPPGVPRPQVGPGPGYQEALLPGEAPQPPADSPPPAVLSHIPRPPHTDISDLSDPAPQHPMKFPDDDVSSGCCDG